jgi:hypothetical protein
MNRIVIARELLRLAREVVGKTISKTFKTPRQAESYQNRLYERFDSVKLLRSPMFSEEGAYTWQVDKPTGKVAGAQGLVRVARGLVSVIQYKDLNDAVGVTGNNRYATGSSDIWYMKDAFFREGLMGYDGMKENGTLPDPRALTKTHVLIGSIRESNLDEIHWMMQGEIWSPNGEALTMLTKKGVHHTSMSVGDIIVVGSRTNLVDRMDFVTLKGN